LSAAQVPRGDRGDRGEESKQQQSKPIAQQTSSFFKLNVAKKKSDKQQMVEQAVSLQQKMDKSFLIQSIKRDTKPSLKLQNCQVTIINTNNFFTN
jgi:hypothetical protein